MPWYTYIVLCADNTFYTGITDNITRRINDHNTGKGAKYTRGRSPVKLVYLEESLNKSTASRREYQVKKLRKVDKAKLVATYYS